MPITRNNMNEKSSGRIYTPDFIVNNILDLSGYFGPNVLKKHVIDNSCGDGAFLTIIAERYCRAALDNGESVDEIAGELSRYVHGIEIDASECGKCIKNLNEVIQKYAIPEVNWDVNCADALSVRKYDGKMDFVLGNPPYVRVHNLGESFDNIKKYTFSQNGMTDLYIVFYEIGLRMLGDNGILGYITPSSFFNSIAGKYMRDYLVKNNLLDKIVDLKHYQPFTATTYTAIAVLKKGRTSGESDYFEYDETAKAPFYVDSLTPELYYIADKFYFSDREKLKELRKILCFCRKKDNVSVKNGFATLADKFFIGCFDFEEYTIPVIKASTGKHSRCLFPYRNSRLVAYDVLLSNPKIKDYYEQNMDLLKNRSVEKDSDWYGFGRSQGIIDVYAEKYSINSLMRTPEDIKLVHCEAGTGVYSGLYIITSLSEEELRSIIINDNFAFYIAMLGKYKSGGYYTFSSKDLKIYLEYKIAQRSESNNE